jgi:hypothetical protein
MAGRYRPDSTDVEKVNYITLRVSSAEREGNDRHSLHTSA